jgi:hypothetical protein
MKPGERLMAASHPQARDRLAQHVDRSQRHRIAVPGDVRACRTALREGADAEFFTRLQQAALAAPQRDPAMLQEQLDGDWESFDSIAFTPPGDLWWGSTAAGA